MVHLLLREIIPVTTCARVCVCVFLAETRSQNTEKLSVNQVATVLLNFLQQAKEEGERNV